MAKLTQISPKISRCPHLAPPREQMGQHVKTRKYFFERGIIVLHFGENTPSLPSPIFEEAWQTHCASFI